MGTGVEMKLLICLIASAIVAAGLSGTLAEGDQMRPQERKILEDEAQRTYTGFQGKKLRRRRMTCEALSFPLPYGHLNHAACASYCFASGQNFRGHCEFGWCKCK